MVWYGEDNHEIYPIKFKSSKEKGSNPKVIEAILSEN